VGILALAVLAAGAMQSAAAETAWPRTIPLIRSWEPAAGRFEVKPDLRILIQQGSATLHQCATLLVDELARELRVHATVAVGTATLPGDVALSLGSVDQRIGEEGYELQVGAAITIRARAAAGLLYGTQTLLQLLKQTPDHELAGGQAVDWPRYPERGLMLDVARLNFPRDVLAIAIRKMAYFKLNYLHLHLSDNEGFRVVIETHRGVTSQAHLSADDVRQLLDLAAQYCVSIVPEIDMPGHMKAALANYPDYQLRNRFGGRNQSILDITNPAAVAFAHDLVGEVAKEFQSPASPYWHDGGDEVFGGAPPDWWYPKLTAYARQHYPAAPSAPAADAKDALIGFLNSNATIVQPLGLGFRVWNDELAGSHVVQLAPDTIVDWWTNHSLGGDWLTVSPPQLLQRGYPISNEGFWPTYYLPAKHPFPANASARQMYERWQVNLFEPFSFTPINFYKPYALDPSDTRVRGAHLNVWNDSNAKADPKQVLGDSLPRLALIAQKTWNSDTQGLSYAGFTSLEQSLRIHDDGGDARTPVSVCVRRDLTPP
jgi:hexosaminidase